MDSKLYCPLLSLQGQRALIVRLALTGYARKGLEALENRKVEHYVFYYKVRGNKIHVYKCYDLMCVGSAIEERYRDTRDVKESGCYINMVSPRFSPRDGTAKPGFIILQHFIDHTYTHCAIMLRICLSRCSALPGMPLFLASGCKGLRVQ